ncbi:MAG: GNAT family N-acetyltransferase [Actinomycetota bacterium]|nr:GNAT family N-acetyltransferase [Actinomycetota bacterium]
MFQPLRTDRLLLRRVHLDDVEALWRRRNEPRAAELQAWPLPYTRSQAEELIQSALNDDGPRSDEWFMMTIADPGDSEVIGELVLQLKWGGRAAEIGYTLDPAWWGRGYATEASSALVEWLFSDERLTRVEGMLHPDNVASARVLEKVGMKLEGHTRLSFWLGDENSDDLIYGMTRSDWVEWQNRPIEAPKEVRLVEITPDNYGRIGRLETHHTQRSFVATMAQSYADALFPEVYEGAPMVPWMRGVAADGDLVGFVMLAEITDHHPEPYLWRLLVDRLHQRRGIGTSVLDEVVAAAEAMGAHSLVTSWEEGRGSPKPFYERYGFESTGRIIDGEVEARLAL